MSTGPRAQTLIQGNQSPEQDASQSALYYLFQEVSKLTSPIHQSFIETNSTSTWIKSEEDTPSFVCSGNQGLSHMSLSPQGNNVQENPLKVLSLINLQCERLLHQREDQGLLSDFDHPSPSSSLRALEAGHRVKSDGPNFDGTLQSSSSKKQTVSVSQLHKGREDYSLENSVSKPELSFKSSSEVCSIKTQITESTETVKPEAPQTTKVRFNVELGLRSDWTKDSLSTQHSFYDFLPEAHTTKEPCNNQQQISASNDEQSVAKPILTLDHNANICVNTNSPCDKTLNSPLSVESVEPETSEPSSSLPQPASTAECGLSSEKTSQQENRNTFPAESSHEQKEDSVQCTDQCTDQCPSWRAKRRKQSHPSRSASVQDPDFQGVAFRMDTELDDTKEQCRLLITSKYSKELPKSVKKPRLKTKLSQKCLKTSSDEESDPATSGTKGKVCASCSTKKTPMWRDAEDGTPLCNACGIRYKKYRVRCVNCWHIPKKEGNSISRCVKCGNFVRLASAQRRPTI